MKQLYLTGIAIVAFAASAAPTTALCSDTESVNAESLAPRPNAEGPNAEAQPSYEPIPVAVSVAPSDKDSDVKRPSNRVIEEIVVTAQKRSENLQDVPISIQAFSGDALAARGLEDTTQLGQSVPGLQFTGTAGFTLIFLRGIGTDQFIPSADPSIATYVDGIYIPNGHGATTSLGNVKQVEVLKGPQGTLFGRNSTGGAISVTTLEPTDDFIASAEGEVGRFDSRSVKANISGGITEWLSAALSGAYSYQDSYYTNSVYDPKPTEVKAARLKLNIHPTENITLGLTANYSDQQGQSTVIGKNTDPTLLGRALGIQPQADNYDSESDHPAYTATTQDFYYGNLTWNLPWFDLKVLASDQFVETKPAIVDFDGSKLPIAGFDVIDEYIDLQTGELQLVSNEESWAADSFKWVIGLYHLRSKAGVDPVYFLAAPDALNSALDIVNDQTGLSLSLPQGLLDRFEFTPAGNQGAGLAFTGLLGTRSTSAFAQGTYSINDWLDFTVGGRYQRERRYLTKSETGAISPVDGSIVNLLPFDLQSATAKNFSPKAVVSARPRDNTLIYASYSIGYKSGTYNIANIYLPPDYIVPEEVTTYEIGAKSDFFGGALRLNGAIFNNDIKNMQTGLVSLLSGGAVRFQSVPKSRTRGAEFDGTLLPFPEWNPGLAITANAAYVDATYVDYPDASGFQEGTGLYSNSKDVSGNRIVRTPKLSAGLGAVQAIDVSNGSFEIAADGYYNSGFYYDAYNTAEEKKYAVLNARISYLHNPWNTRVTVFGKNVLDRRYHQQKFQTDFGVISTLAPPVEVGLRINWDF